MNYIISNPILKKQIQTVLKRQQERYVFYSTLEYLKKNVNYYDIQILEEMKEKRTPPTTTESSEIINPVDQEMENKIIPQKGHGGGKNTNREGKSFETLTENIAKLLEQGFIYNYWNKTSKHAFTLSKSFPLAIPVSKEEAIEENECGKGIEKRILYLAQAGFKTFMKNEYGLIFPRYPDEAYLVAYSNGRKVLKILEKKAQNVEGSVDTKLMAANAFREEYRFFGEGKFEVEYAFCLNAFFKEKFHSTSPKNRKYIFLQQLLKKEGIEVFYGEDADYFDRLSEWIHRDSVNTEVS